MVNRKTLSLLAIVASFFALGVIGLGAFTRLMDAGLGCPDWPGCFGHIIVPLTDQAQKLAETNYPGSHVVFSKAWAEMVHRYFVGGLSLFILIIIGVIFGNKESRVRSNILLAIGLLLLLAYQILLGQLTVTLKLLPIIVTQHLLGGFLILSLLWAVYLNNNVKLKAKLSGGSVKAILIAAVIGWVIVLFQITLGAWTSTNYASLSCSGFPFCKNDQAMVFYFKEAFTLFSTIGINYEGGVLSEAIRQTIQMSHRFGALILTFYLVGLMMLAAPRLKRSHELMKSLYWILGLLILQLCLGISNIIFKLPLGVAMAHNLTAALLLLSVMTFIFKLATTQCKASCV